MSNHLAFATVTATLQALLDVVAKKAVTGAAATVERPDLVDKNTTGVNLFLYQVTPNIAWRNADLPTRRPDGTAVLRPQAAFDLDYLLSFHGKESDYEPQRLLGSVAGVLHSQPVLSREMVRDASKSPLADSNLAEQAELVRFAPLGLNLEELSKLWSVFFQVPYKLSLVYQASVVLIDGEVTAGPALPVQSRNVYVALFRQPEVDAVVADAGRGEPILPGDTIVLQGRNLRGEVTKVRIGDAEVEPKGANLKDGAIHVQLAPGLGLRSGVLGAQVVHLRLMGTPPTPHFGTASNVAPFVLRPKIERTAPDPPITISAPDAKGVRTVSVWLTPKVGKEQRVVLLLNLFRDPVPLTDPRAFSAVAEPRSGDTDTDSVMFKVRGLKVGQELVVRIQVDGAESMLEMADGVYAAPKVKVPSP